MKHILVIFVCAEDDFQKNLKIRIISFFFKKNPKKSVISKFHVLGVVVFFSSRLDRFVITSHFNLIDTALNIYSKS